MISQNSSTFIFISSDPVLCMIRKYWPSFLTPPSTSCFVLISEHHMFLLKVVLRFHEATLLSYIHQPFSPPSLKNGSQVSFYTRFFLHSHENSALFCFFQPPPPPQQLVAILSFLITLNVLYRSVAGELASIYAIRLAGGDTSRASLPFEKTEKILIYRKFIEK